MHGPATGTVMCHGCFDVLHIGHIRHLQEAATLGDRLVVSVTSDRYVNKGADRPRFSQEIRMETLRALDCVDEVILNDEPGPIKLIEQIKPAVYVKGIDYACAMSHEMPEIAHLHEWGGRLYITTTDKFSSSRLINQEKFDDETVKYLEKVRDLGYRDKILAAFELADKIPLTFVGETIIDEYRYVRALGKTSKEFVLATVEERREEFEGGVVAAAKHADWRDIDIITGIQPLTKVRYVDVDFSRKLFEVYSARALPLERWQRDRLHDQINKAIKDRSLVVFDFGHGLLIDATRQMLRGTKFLAVNAQSNAGNFGFNRVTNYPTADLICVDDPEARLATGLQHHPIETVVRGLSIRAIESKIIVTHGRLGCVTYSNGDLTHIPAFAQNAVDTMGAGDAFLAVAGPLAATGLPTEMAAFAGNVAGAIKVSIVGHRRHVGRQELITTIESLLK